MQMRKIQFYKRIFYKNDCVLHKLFCAMMSRDNMYDKCMMSVFTCDATLYNFVLILQIEGLTN